MATSTLERRTVAYRRDEDSRRKSYAAMIEEMRRANREDGLSYDKIVEITGLSKSQVQRICTEA